MLRFPRRLERARAGEGLEVVVKGNRGGSAAANAAGDLGASSMCQVTSSGAGPPSAGGRAVNGTPAAVPVIGERTARR